VNCYSEDNSIVTFEICTGNGWDYIDEKMTVTFYDADPSVDTAKILSTFSPVRREGTICREYLHTLPSSTTGELYGVINNLNVNRESDYSNNTSMIESPAFSANFDDPIIRLIKPDNTVQLQPVITGNENFKFLWTPITDLSCSDCENPVATMTESRKYVLEVKNDYYCKDAANIFIQTFTAFTNSKYAIPTAFTPNGDGINDVFYIIGNKNIRILKSFMVFNRWGLKVFETSNIPSNDKTYGWKGTNADPGTYVYFADVENVDGTTEVVKGTVILIK
jgi:gliding motility-associated-like protein